MSDDEEYVGGQVFGESFNDRNRAQGGVGENFEFEPKTEEGRWNIKVMVLTNQEKMKFSVVKDIANQIDKYLNLNPYTFVLAYKIVNFKGDEPIDTTKLKEIKTKIEKGNTIEEEPFSNFMKISDVIRYAYLIRATYDKGLV